MNYLAHAYLSFNDPEVLVGNMISDFVKGRKQFDYPERIHKGILLHRAIDEFTDAHPCTHELKQLFRPQYRLYSGAFIDIVYDYFLANDVNEFATENDLLEFTALCYRQLASLKQWHGTSFGAMFPYMSSQNWLYNYRYQWGIEKSFEGMRRRSAYIPETGIAFQVFLDHITAMKPLYQQFFGDVKIFSAEKMDQLLNQ
jgi:acyl carrier protein phosphodiesterase